MPAKSFKRQAKRISQSKSYESYPTRTLLRKNKNFDKSPIELAQQVKKTKCTKPVSKKTLSKLS
jgi:hypothetical protein